MFWCCSDDSIIEKVYSHWIIKALNLNETERNFTYDFKKKKKKKEDLTGNLLDDKKHCSSGGTPGS